ncbi:MAG: helix-turn-helix domain-containing protein [Sediminibacterium sp.]|jgi:AraC-like DNA-binding protein
MILKDFVPAPDVQAFVQFFRIVHLEFSKEDVIPIKAYPPRPEQCLAFYPYDRETVEYVGSNKVVNHLPVVLYGQFTQVTNRMIGHQFLVFQIVFYPGALYNLTGIPSSELVNEYLDGSIFFGNQVHEVNEQLYEAKSYEMMIAIGNQFVRTLIAKSIKPILPIDWACAQMLNKTSQLSIDQIARQACYSARQLERKFKERTGVNPKLFMRIIRFDNAFRQKNSHPSMDWLRIALECDYHDYQHLVRDYKDFTQLSPNQFHLIEDKAPERKFGLNEGFYKRK